MQDPGIYFTCQLIIIIIVLWIAFHFDHDFLDFRSWEVIEVRYAPEDNKGINSLKYIAFHN